MGEMTTISVSESTLERFKETKAELDDSQPDAPDHNADSFLNALIDTWDAVDDDGNYSPMPNRFDASASERIARDVTEDLVAELPPKIAAELENRR